MDDPGVHEERKPVNCGWWVVCCYDEKGRMRDSGCYQILMHLDKSRKIRVGRLGLFDFPAGWYVYTGSALGGLSARIQRHFKKEKRLHWHIDYLLEHARICGVKKCLTRIRKECSLNARIFTHRKAKIVVKKFGSTDCRCETHLAFFDKKPDLDFENISIPNN